MKPNALRPVLALVWLLTVAAAYWIGHRAAPRGAPSPGAGDGEPRAVTIAGPAGKPGASGGAGAVAESPAGVGGAAEAGPRDVRALIAEARNRMGGGSGLFFNPSAMMRAFGPLMELSPDEAREAIDEVLGTVTEPQQKMVFLSMLLGRWGEQDPQAALAYAEKLKEEIGPTASQATFSVVGSWAQKDPGAAWEWYQKKRETDDGSDGLMGLGAHLTMIFNGMASRDLDGALRRLGDLDDEQDRMMAVSGIAGSSQDAAARERLLARSAALDPETRQSLRQGVLNQWAMLDPTGAMDWLRELPADERTGLVNSVSHAFMWTNPEKGAAFLLEGATEADLPQRYQQIVTTWATRNPNAAGQWLNQQPPGPAQDQARSSFANIVARRDPESAMEWAKSITSQPVREGNIQSLYRQWHQKDPAAADAALATSGLPAARIQAIQQAPPR